MAGKKVMSITEEQYKQRIASLQAERELYLGKANACTGAIQDCEFWLAQLEQPAAPKDTPAEES